MNKEYKISVCTICMNRIYHLKETLPANIKDNLTYTNLEHVILDYNSQDDLEAWVKQHLVEYIEKGRLKYFRAPDPKEFNMTHSKNMVSKLATGDIVCLVDADNYTGKDYAGYVNQCFNKQRDIFLTTIAKLKIKNEIDVLGRICFWKNDFLKVEGFDEFMSSYGFDDYDFANRLTLAGSRRVVINNKKYLRAITHTLNERVENQKVSRDFKSLFIRHVNPSESELLFLFADQSFSLGIMKDNHAKAALSLQNLLKNKRYKYNESLATEDWIQGRWTVDNRVLNLHPYEKKNIVLEVTDEQNQLLSKNGKQRYFKIENKNIILDLLLFHTMIRNRNKMNANFRQKKVIVNDAGFGVGRVFFNFNNNVSIHI